MLINHNVFGCGNRNEDVIVNVVINNEKPQLNLIIYSKMAEIAYRI